MLRPKLTVVRRRKLPTKQIPILPSIDNRYTGAKLEACARIQARQFVQMTAVVILSTLVALMISGNFDITKLNDHHYFLLSFGSALFGVMVVGWVGHQDFHIGLLDSYCKSLEQFGRIDNAVKVPCWHDLATSWLQRGYACRFWAMNAFGLALMGTALPNMLVLYANGYKKLTILLAMLFFLWVLFLRSVLLPPVRLHDVKDARLKFATPSWAIVVVSALLAWFSLAVHDGRKIAPELHYEVVIGVVSWLVSLGALALYVYFERKRYLVLVAGEFDFSTGKFVIDLNRVESPFLIRWYKRLFLQDANQESQ